MLSATELVRKFESAAQNLVDQMLPRQMVALKEEEQPLEKYEIVLFICNLYSVKCTHTSNYNSRQSFFNIRSMYGLKL